MIRREAANSEKDSCLDKVLFTELDVRVPPNLDISGWPRAFLRLIEGRELCGVIGVIGNPAGEERGRAKRMIKAAAVTRMARKSLRGTRTTGRFEIFEQWNRDVKETGEQIEEMEEIEKMEEMERWKENVSRIIEWLFL